MNKKPVVTTDIAREILRHHFRKRPSEVKELQGGLANFVYEGRIGAKSYIVRISDQAAKLQVFLKEQWAVCQARKKGVPTPEVLEVGTEPTGFPAMILNKVEGLNPQVQPDTNRILTELGSYARRINSIRTSDFGHVFNWSRNTLSRKTTWPAFIREELAVGERIELFRKHRMLPRATLSRLVREVEHMKRLKGRATLCHGDLRLKNVLVNNEGRISVILDWENASSSLAPYWELSIALHDLSIDQKEAFLHGYGMELREYEAIAPTIKAINLLNYWTVIAGAVEAKDKARLAQLRHRLSGAMDLYSI